MTPQPGIGQDPALDQQAALFPGGIPFKTERFTRLEIVCEGGRRMMRKHYRTNPWLGWRTIGHPSRASREYRNLARARMLGVPCLEPLSHATVRGRFFQVRNCTICTSFVPDARDLRALFRAESPSSARVLRRAVARELGAVLRLLHRAGALHLRAASRNFLVFGDPQQPRVLLLDVPYMVFSRRSLHGTWWAGLDLFDAFFSGHRKEEASAPERLRGLLAYAGGDHALCRRYWRSLGARSYWWNRLFKGLAIVCFKCRAWLGGQGPARPGAAENGAGAPVC